MIKRILNAFGIFTLFLLAMPSLALAAGADAPQIKKTVYVNEGDEPSILVEYADEDGKTWIELYLVEGPIGEGDDTGDLGRIEDSDGNIYRLVGIQTIDPSNSSQLYKNDDGNWVVDTKVYLAGAPKPEEGRELGVIIETGSEAENMTMSPLVQVTVPAEGESAEFAVGVDGDIAQDDAVPADTEPVPEPESEPEPEPVEQPVISPAPNQPEQTEQAGGIPGAAIVGGIVVIAGLAAFFALRRKK